MAKAPGDRYATAADLARALDRWPPPTAVGESIVKTTPFERTSLSSTTLGGSAAEARPPRRRRRAAVVAVGAGLSVLAGTAIVLWRLRPPMDIPTVTPVVTELATTFDARPPPSAPDAAPPPSRMIRLDIVTTPDGATVYRAVDGVRLGTTPFSRELERTDGQAEFLLRKAGYQDQRITLPTDHDAMTGIKLTPEPRKRPPGKKDPLDPYGD